MLWLVALLVTCHASAEQSPSQDGSNEKFLFGLANSAFQAEGNPGKSDWQRWSHAKGRIKDGTDADEVNDFWNRYPEDFALARKAGLNSFRLSIAWERIEPEPGKFDEAALNHYAAMIREMRKQGLEPIVTLHHFVLPDWLADRGGLLAGDFVERYSRYASKVVEKLADPLPDGSPGVHYFMTFNEPMVLVAAGYLGGMWPPGIKNDGKKAARAAAALAEAHIAAVGKIRENPRTKDVKIGIAQHWRVFDPIDGKPWNRLAGKLMDHVLNRQFISALMTGRIYLYSPPMHFTLKRVPLPMGKPTLDYLGLNQYGRFMVGLNPRVELSEGPGPKSDMGWEIYPEGIYRSIQAASKYGLPIMISETGLADRRDSKRQTFVNDVFQQVGKALRDGYKVFGLIFWSETDNYEWAEGLTPGFGFADLNRNPRPSLGTLRHDIAEYEPLFDHPPAKHPCDDAVAALVAGHEARLARP